MNHQVQILRSTRKNLIKVYQSVPYHLRSVIPEGFSNNLHWNLGHCLVTQQLLLYKLSGLKMLIPDEMVETYRKGTLPEEGEREELEQSLISLVDVLEEDLAHGKFEQYQSYHTSYGIELTDFNMALSFNNTHEALHLGYMMALKKTILNVED